MRFIICAETNNNNDCYVAIKRNAQFTDTNNKGQQTERMKINTN